MYRFFAFLLDILYLPALFIVLPLLYLKQKKYRRSIPKRFLAPPPRSTKRPAVWIHGVSVGEVKAAKPFIEQFAQQFPAWDILISTTTNTGYEEATRLYPTHSLFRFPFDLSWLLQKTFQRLKPNLILLMELELWPNFLLLARHHQVPVVVLNGRLSENSYRGYKKFFFFLSPMFHTVKNYLVQNQEYADRFAALGVSKEKICVTGNMKMDQQIPKVTRELRKILKFSPTDLVLVCGSTHPGENEVLIQHYKRLKEEFPSLRLVLVPRHPEKVDEVATALAKDSFLRWKKESLEEHILAPQDPIILVDQMGVLTDLYQIANLVFVGKSLLAHGGQNMVEPVLLGKMVIVGPYTENFKEEMKFLREHQALQEVQNAEELFQAFRQQLNDPNLSQKGTKSREIWQKHSGASQRNLNLLKEFGYLEHSPKNAV